MLTGSESTHHIVYNQTCCLSSCLSLAFAGFFFCNQFWTWGNKQQVFLALASVHCLSALLPYAEPLRLPLIVCAASCRPWLRLCKSMLCWSCLTCEETLLALGAPLPWSAPEQPLWADPDRARSSCLPCEGMQHVQWPVWP